MGRMSELAVEQECDVRCKCPNCTPTIADYQEMYDMETLARFEELLNSNRLESVSMSGDMRQFIGKLLCR
jgi:hypothetical protein